MTWTAPAPAPVGSAKPGAVAAAFTTGTAATGTAAEGVVVMKTSTGGVHETGAAAGSARASTASGMRGAAGALGAGALRGGVAAGRAGSTALTSGGGGGRSSSPVGTGAEGVSTGSLVFSFLLSLSGTSFVLMSFGRLYFSVEAVGSKAACGSVAESVRSGGGTSPETSFRGAGAAVSAGAVSGLAVLIGRGLTLLFGVPAPVKLSGAAPGEGTAEEGTSAGEGGTVPASREANKAAPGVMFVRAGKPGGMTPAGGGRTAIKSGGNQGLLVSLSNCSGKSNARIIGRGRRKLEGAGSLSLTAHSVMD